MCIYIYIYIYITLNSIINNKAHIQYITGVLYRHVHCTPYIVQ